LASLSVCKTQFASLKAGHFAPGTDFISDKAQRV
jgi:hypothetical protein